MMVAEFEQHAPKLLRKLQVGHHMAPLELRTFDLSFSPFISVYLYMWALVSAYLQNAQSILQYTRIEIDMMIWYYRCDYIAFQHAALVVRHVLLQISGLSSPLRSTSTFPILAYPFLSFPILAYPCLSLPALTALTCFPVISSPMLLLSSQLIVMRCHESMQLRKL